jgi:hypothetical protein
MNTPPIVSPEAWEAARQKMLAKEKAAVDGMAAGPRRIAIENRLRNFPPGPLPDQTEVPARPHAGTAPGYRAGAASADTTADTRAGHSRALSRFLIVFCGSVAATWAWWSYGDAARRMIASSYSQLRSLAAPRALTASKAPDMIVPDPNQLEATLREPHTMPQSPDRIVAGEELAQPGEPLNIKSTEAKALKTSSEKGKQVSAANQYDASCLPSASAVLRNHPGARPSWTLRAPGHDGTQCWYAAERPRVSDHRPRASDH